MMLWTSLMSSGERTNDSATRSTPRRSANRRSSASFSDIAGTETATLGSETPLWLETDAALDDQAADVVAGRRRSTSSATLPSSISSRSPAFTSCGSLP